jgi:hypothetical protein
MATVAGGYKINGPVFVNSTFSRSTIGVSTGTFYTAPANGYAMITVREITVNTTGTSGSSNANISLSGMILTSTTSGTGNFYFGSVPRNNATPGVPAQVIYVGPGQSITYTLDQTTALGSLAAAVSFFGVEYVNV